MRRLIWIVVGAVALLILWMMLSQPTPEKAASGQPVAALTPPDKARRLAIQA